MRKYEGNIIMNLTEIEVNTRNWVYSVRIGIFGEPLWMRIEPSDSISNGVISLVSYCNSLPPIAKLWQV